MSHLEAIDARDRLDGTAHKKRLRQIPPETGRFLALMVASSPDGEIIEIGSSAGYSTLWLSLACKATGRSITTFEILPEKAQLARETFEIAKVTDVVTLVEGDAMAHLPGWQNVAFCFLDAEKEIYERCYELLIANLTQGGILLADNVISHEQQLKPFVDRALGDERVDALVIPIGKGLLLCRKA
jgi:predicted O-methyltransferase YrrM